ncbi:uroporphyrinogen-III synthase [Neisseria perflava]|jgi:uroporphyrinogen-III synthase|nr:uroporphyrinogen-III synthase [Neisseria perflava]
MPTLLIIRPSNRPKQDIQTCHAAGWQAQVLSPIEIEADRSALNKLPEQFKQADVVFWVSPTAIETAAPHLNFSEGPKAHITVGQTSQHTLAQFSPYPVFSPEDGNDSEAVLRMPIWKNLPPNARVLIIRGHGGRDFLAEKLTELGFQIDIAEIYFRRPHAIDWQSFKTEDIAAAYVTSGEIAREFFHQIPPQFSRFFESLLYFTHHPRIADALRIVGAKHVETVTSLSAALSSMPQRSQAVSPVEDNKDTQQVANTAAPAPERSENTRPSEQIKPTQPQRVEASMPESNNLPQNNAPVIIKQSGGKALAAGATVLALLGLGASGFLFVQGQNVLKNQELEFNQKIDKAALGESENASLLKDNLNRQTAIQAELDRLNNGQKNNSDQILQMQKAYQELLKGRINWLVDEAESMLNTASQQLMLSGNLQGAVSVLEHIDSRLSRFEQPELIPIKQAISNDLAALKNRPYVDISATALRIDRLETGISGLPLVLDGVLKPGAAPVEATNSGTWWENTWEKSLNALKGLVEVRHLDSNDAMLISPDQTYFIRENLRLRLLDARIALLQHNGEVYQSDLNNVEATVKQYFDSKSPATQSWLKELAELKALDVRMISDDSLKASLSAVRAYQEGSRTQMTTEEATQTQAAEKTASAPATTTEQATTAAPAAASAPQSLEAPALPSENKKEPAAEAAKPQNQTKPAAKPQNQTKPAAKIKGEQA